jgi:ligand-binding sensor domain-containing protein
MAQLINYGREMLRINTQKNAIEYSTNDGRSWISRYTGSSAGIFYDLLQFGNELLACTSKGIYYSTNEGRSWISRYTGSSVGTFQQLSADGHNLLAITSKGLYYSTNEGRSWIKR